MTSSMPGDQRTLVDVIRTPVCVTTEDSLQRFIDVIAYTPYSMLPVLNGESLVGYMHQADAQFLLGIDDELERQAASYSPVGRHMRAPDITTSPETSLAELGSQFAETAVEMIAVVDRLRDNRYAGVVVCRDLLTGDRLQARPRLPTVGGMATPF